MDIATIIGLISGTALLLWAILSKADLGTFIDGGSIAIVCGGSLSAAMISFPIQNLLSVAKVVKNCFFSKSRNPVALIHVTAFWRWKTSPVTLKILFSYLGYRWPWTERTRI